MLRVEELEGKSLRYSHLHLCNKIRHTNSYQANEIMASALFAIIEHERWKKSSFLLMLLIHNGKCLRHTMEQEDDGWKIGVC